MYLSIEASSLVSSVAVGTKDKLVGEITMQASLTHSEQLLVHIDRLLTMAEVDKKQLKGIVVSIGPGSFTGLRIGLGTAKAMAYGLGIPIVGIMTMEAMAYNVEGRKERIVIFIDAQKNNVYEAIYQWNDGTLHCLQEPTVKYIEDALEELSQSEEQTVFLGDGALLEKEAIEAYEMFHLASPATLIPRSASLLQAGVKRFENDDVDQVMTLVPFYMRRSEAEVLWDKRHGKEGTR